MIDFFLTKPTITQLNLPNILSVYTLYLSCLVKIVYLNVGWITGIYVTWKFNVVYLIFQLIPLHHACKNGRFKVAKYLIFGDDEDSSTSGQNSTEEQNSKTEESPSSSNQMPSSNNNNNSNNKGKDYKLAEAQKQKRNTQMLVRDQKVLNCLDHAIDSGHEYVHGTPAWYEI